MVSDITTEFDYYARAGAALLSFNAGEKGPKYDDWHNFTSRDPAQWQAWRAAGLNIGVHSGNSNWIVVDGDTKGEGGADGAFARWSQLCRDHGDDPNKYPAQVRSRSGGFHIYFSVPAGLALTRRQPVLDIEFRAGRHQTVIPPSQVDGLAYSFFANPQLPFAGPQWMIDICREVETPAVHAEIRTFDLNDIRDRCRFLVTKRRFDVENDWVNSIWAIRRALGESGWSIAVMISDIDFKNRLESVWHREGTGKGKPMTCATIIDWSNELGYREWKHEHMWDGVPLPTVKAPPIAPTVQNAATLLTREFAPVRYVVPGYLAEGCTILAGKPKIGKSWFVLDAALAIAGGNGGRMFGQIVEQGDVLYLALEDNERRLKNRIRKVLGPFEAGPERFEYHTGWKRADEGIADIEAWIRAKPKPTLIIVDVLQRIRAVNLNNQNAYAGDYETVAALQKLASQHNVAVVVVHHLRKSAADNDPFDKISGTLGLSGAADSILILDRDGQGVTLYGRGRDIEEIETAVQFDKGRCRWTVLGSAPDVRRSDERKSILDALTDGTSMTPADIAAATGMASGNVRRLLFKMARKGEVSKIGGGYVSEVAPLSPGNSSNGNAERQPIIVAPPY